MIRIHYLTPALAVAGALTEQDFAAIAAQGFKTLISNRPDGEEAGQLTAREEATLSWREGIAFRHVPAAKHEVLEDQVLEALEQALTTTPGPVLLHCKSGLRSAIAWAAVAVRAGGSADAAIEAAKAAGFNLEVVRDEIEGHAREALDSQPGRADCQAAA